MQEFEIKRRKRVLMLVTTFGFTGGAEAQVARLATELVSNGWEVRIVALIAPAVSVAALEGMNVKVHSLGMTRRIPDVRAVFRLRSIIKSFQPDVVHCHMYHANLLGRITRLICPIPRLICTAHSTKESSTRGGPTWHKELLYRVTDSLADATTTICGAGLDRYIRVGAAPRSKLRMIPNGIDTNVYKHSEARRARTREALGLHSKFVWLAVGRMVVQKDYPTLFSAVSMLSDRNFEVLIAGGGPLEDELRRECAARGLNDRIRFCGVREDVIELYSAADAFVMSSEVEGLPMALLEAASMGLPAVVTDVGGNAEVVTNGVTGFLVPPKNPAELALALNTVMQATPERLKSMSRAARQMCYEQYRIDVIADRWIGLYEGSSHSRALPEVAA